MNNRTFLDIDETILTKNLLLPKNTQKSDELLEQSNSKPFFIIQPAPGICIKTKTDSGEKIFLNICTSNKIPSPDILFDAKLYEILSEENSEFVIPMSIGSARLECDKGGNPCVTCDIAINTTYFEKCQENKKFLLFTISVIMDGVSNKLNKTLDVEDYVILKNRKVMGKLQQHRIENREPRTHSQIQKSLIEEIENDTRNMPKREDKISQSEDIFPKTVPNSKLNYILLKQPLEGTPIHLIGLFQIPIGITSEEVEVLLDQNRIVITIDKIGLTYDLSVPYIINVAYAKCTLDNNIRVLRLDMPVENVSENIQTS